MHGRVLWVCFTCDQPDAIHDHPVVGHDLNRGCGAADIQEGMAAPGQGNCGELVGYGAYREVQLVRAVNEQQQAGD